MRTGLLCHLLIALTLLLGGVSCRQGGPQAPAAAQATPARDTTPPMFSEIKLEEAALDILEVIWKTDEPTIGRLEYGLTPDIGLSSAWTAELSTNGGILQTGLVPMQTYNFRVRVKDAAGNETVSEDKTVTLYQDSIHVYLQGLKWER